jgi:protein-disulfide isomerase
MKRLSRLPLALTATMLLISSLAWSVDNSLLTPPKGSKVAIVVFEDLECPQCARAAPMLHEAAKKYNVALVQHDFPLRQHPWSYQAAVNARYFDSKSEKLGDEYRLYVFANQNSITKANLQGITEKWAADHKVEFPFMVDPSGQFAGKVDADRQAGEKIPLDHTPTIYIVSDSGHGVEASEVKDLNDLYQMLDDAVKKAGPTTEAKKPAPHKAANR